MQSAALMKETGLRGTQPTRSEPMSSVGEASAPALNRAFRIISVNLYATETDWLDGIRERLRRHGLLKSTRSEWVRLALAQLKHRLRDRSDGELVEFFVNGLRDEAIGRNESQERPLPTTKL